MAGSSGIQTSVNFQLAPALAGDFASQNPRYTADFGAGGAIAGASGLYVGRACWATPPNDSDGAATILNSSGTGAIAGIIGREQQGLNTTFLSDATMFIPQGFPVTPYTSADLWVVNDGATQALPGQKAYATFVNGKFTFAATATPATGAVVTGSIAASTASVTASIADNILTATVIGSGALVVGGILSGSGVATGTQITGQLTPLLAGETAGGVGRYYVSIPEQTVASTTVSETYGTFTAASGLTGLFNIGDVLSGSGVTSGTKITALGTGLGGLGTYIVTPTQTAGSTSITAAATNVETSWRAVSSALAGELVKIINSPTP